MSTITWIILVSAVLTYATRVGGHLVVSRFSSLHPRVEAALDAVPAAVLTTLVAPVLISGEVTAIIALFVAGLVALRFSPTVMFLAGVVTAVAIGLIV